MAQANEGANLLRDAVTRIPVYTGDGNDAFTPNQWIKRIQKARDTAGWNDANTMSFVYVSLRGKALKWHECLTRSGVEINNFVDFTAAFLESFAPARTARTATVNLHEVKQQPAEDVVGFYSRVINIIDELEILLPAAARRPIAVAMPAAIAALAGFEALADPVKQIVPTIFDLGVTTALNHVAIQLFVAGLKPAIRDEMMKNMPVLLWEAFQQAITLEKIHTPLKATMAAAVNEIADEQDNCELDGEIEAVRAQLNRLTSKKSQYRGKFTPSGGGSGYRNNGQQGKPAQTNFKEVICRVCKKKGHFQDKCFTRLAKGLPCVDANGVPLKNQPPTPPPRAGRVAEIGQQGATGGHHGGAPPHPEGAPTQPGANFMMPPQSQGGYWTPYPPNFP